MKTVLSHLLLEKRRVFGDDGGGLTVVVEDEGAKGEVLVLIPLT